MTNRMFFVFATLLLAACQMTPKKRGFADQDSLPQPVRDQAQNVLHLKMGSEKFKTISTSFCTGFLIDSDTLITAEHCLGDGFAHETPIELYWLNTGNFSIDNSKKEALFDTHREADKVISVKVLCREQEVYESESFANQQSRCDYILLKISHSIQAKPIPAAHENPKEGQSIYVMGYPAKTDLFAASGGKDSAGNELNLSQGRMSSYLNYLSDKHSELYHALLSVHRMYGDESFEEFLRLKSIGYIFAKGDAYFGMSGGPVLNSQGEWFAILSKATISAELKKPPGSLDTIYFIGIEKSWIEKNMRDKLAAAP